MHPSAFETLSGRTDLSFPEYDDPPAQPMPLLRRWLARAETDGVREPRAVALATADTMGRASTRTVVLTGLDDDGLRFASHTTSRKGRQIAETGWASGLFYWRESGQQVSVSGTVEPVVAHLSDRWWDERPAALHPMSAASRQSDRLPSAAALIECAAELDRSVPLPRPDRFVWYQLTPRNVEFWCAGADRLHRRLRFERSDAGWAVVRLQP